MEKLRELMRSEWKYGNACGNLEMPIMWRNSFLIPIFKEKEDIKFFNNHRAIKLLLHTTKLWEMIIERRIREETKIGEEQFGLKPGGSTTDAMFALRQLMEKYREGQKGLHIVFINLEKAYDRVPWQEI
ncbi:uncharacterized protein [Palaemon carinicauda]|uniref:uncharacterized protein n=1 Tax=Palaemon carinicauda TaxID=392227 RepID=UPI0035B6289D